MVQISIQTISTIIYQKKFKKSEPWRQYKMIKKYINKIYRFICSAEDSPQKKIRINGGKVGNGVFFGKDVIIDYDYAFLLEIGDGVVISARTIIELHDSSLPNVLGNGKTKIGRVKIGNRAYIGVNSVILPGVQIGESAIIGACSLINQDIPTRQVWGGVPAKFLSSVDELVYKRRASERKDVAFFDWIGEPEKENRNYPKVKNMFLTKVREFFEKANIKAVN